MRKTPKKKSASKHNQLHKCPTWRGDRREIQSMVTRMIDLLKSRGITGFFTSLVSSTAQNDTSGEIGVSSLIDTWIGVRELEEEAGKKRTRGLYIVKSRPGSGLLSQVKKIG